MRFHLRASACSFGLLVLCLCSSRHAFAAAYTLTIQVQGSGTVSRNPTNSVYPEGAVVTITAIPNSGWLFTGWSGDASGPVNPLNVAMNTNKVIAAHFQAIPSFTLNVSTSGQGAISLDPPGGTYLSNSVVSVSATPAAGWAFVQWTGDASGNANPLSVNLSAGKSVTAVFAELPAIDTQPQNVSPDIGDTASFSIHAAGNPPLAYQWFFNGSALVGATAATLTLTNVQTTQAGEYWAVVTNPYGSATSSRAMLAVRDACSGTNVVSTCTEVSLRAAMSAGGLVRICCNGTIALSNTIDVARDVALDARDRNVVISGNNAVRLFNLSPGVRFSITNLTLANGRHVGQSGGLPGEGGAIFNNGGTIEIFSSTLTNNQAIGAPAGDLSRPGGEARGGAIFTRSGTVQLHRCEISHGVAQGGSSGGTTSFPSGDALGGAIYATNATIHIIGCVVRNNTCTAPNGPGRSAAARGGAFYLTSGSISVSNSILAANLAFGASAGTGTVPSSAHGGAIAANSGTVIIDHSFVFSNTASGGSRRGLAGQAQGGGIFSSATFLARDCSFSGNQALGGSIGPGSANGQGGAIHNFGSMALIQCSLYSNAAKGGDGSSIIGVSAGSQGQGGGVFNAGEIRATNCTLALNSATGGKGDYFGSNNGIPGIGVGGGIYSAAGLVALANVTIASNSVALGGPSTNRAAGANIANTNGIFSLRNSLVAYGGTNGNAWGVIIDGGFNISSDGSANLNSGSSFNFTDPRLGPLANYGGPTLTMALRPNSPAIDFGGIDGAPSIDQRGLSRPFGAGIDIGAYEFYSNQTELPQLSISSVPNGVTLTFEAFAGTEYRLQASDTLSPPWSEFETIGPFTNPTQVTRTISSTGTSLRFFRLGIP